MIDQDQDDGSDDLNTADLVQAGIYLRCGLLFGSPNTKSGDREADREAGIRTLQSIGLFAREDIVEIIGFFTEDEEGNLELPQ